MNTARGNVPPDATVVLRPATHWRSLDGLRGLAVLMVFCHHLCPIPSGPVQTVCSTLWLGVDLFFVLSGFLITGVLYDTLPAGPAWPRYFTNFYARRALRLMPVYIVVVVVVFVVNAAAGYHLTVWAVPYFLYGSNLVRDLGLPIGVWAYLDVSHLWSLAVEEQFYLVWPVAVLLARTRRRIVLLCLLGSALSVALRFFAAGRPGHFFLGTPYLELPMRLDGLLLGGALAMLLRSVRGSALLTAARLHFALAVGVIVSLASFVIAGHGSMLAATTVRYGYLAAAVTFTAMIALALRPDSWLCCVGEVGLLRTFGRYSYGLYLIHLIPRHWYGLALLVAESHCSNAFTRDAAAVGVFLLYLGLCLGVAALSYHTLETYFLRLKSRFSTGATQTDAKARANA